MILRDINSRWPYGNELLRLLEFNADQVNTLPLGPTRTFKVTRGDSIDISAWTYYEEASSSSGVWGESYWDYTLYSDSTFLFTASGHVGDIKERGEYQIRNDTLVLSYASPGRPAEKFLIDGDSCIISLESHQDYCKVAAGSRTSQLRAL